jgi:hypothetical protein
LFIFFLYINISEKRNKKNLTMARSMQDAELTERFKKLLQEKSTEQLTIKCEDAVITDQTSRTRYRSNWEHTSDEKDVSAFNEFAIKETAKYFFGILSEISRQKSVHEISVLDVSITSSRTEDSWISYRVLLWV